MFFTQNQKSVICVKCKYKAYEPIPKLCPKCSSPLKSENSELSDVLGKTKKKKQELKPKSQPTPKPVYLKSSAKRVSDSIGGVKVKKKKQLKIDLGADKIELIPDQQYFRMFGVISREREEIFCSNETYRYFLEMVFNLDFIASSLQQGALDKITFKKALEDGKTEDELVETEEKCSLVVTDDYIFLVFGKFPDKQGQWVLHQIKKEFSALVNGRPFEELSKVEKSDVIYQFEKRLVFILKQLSKLNQVFSETPIKSTMDKIRVDYVALSYQSIGIFGRILTDNLNFDDMHIKDNEEDALSVKEMQEMLISAKIEAIAAHTFAKTNLLPSWITVKLGFDSYAFIVFQKVRDYYVQVLCEGNPEMLPSLTGWLKDVVEPYTHEVFRGNLKKFKPLMQKITELL